MLECYPDAEPVASSRIFRESGDWKRFQSDVKPVSGAHAWRLSDAFSYEDDKEFIIVNAERFSGIDGFFICAKKKNAALFVGRNAQHEGGFWAWLVDGLVGLRLTPELTESWEDEGMSIGSVPYKERYRLLVETDPVSFIPEDLDKGFALKGWPYAKRA